MTLILLIGKIVSFLVPIIIEQFNPANKIRREDHAFDKALAKNSTDDLSALLSERIDGLQ
jgi:hypothetical protein